MQGKVCDEESDEVKSGHVEPEVPVAYASRDYY